MNDTNTPTEAPQQAADDDEATVLAGYLTRRELCRTVVAAERRAEAHARLELALGRTA